MYNRTCALCGLKQPAANMHKLARNDWLCLDTKSCYMRRLEREHMQEQINSCPNCNSTNLKFEGTIGKPDIEYDTLDSKLSAVRLSSESTSNYDLSCDDCNAQLKITKDGVRAIS